MKVYHFMRRMKAAKTAGTGMMEREFGLRDKVLLFAVLTIFGMGFALYHTNIAVRSEEVEGIITGIGTATDEYLANNPVLAVRLTDGREVAVLYPVSMLLPKIGDALKIKHGFNRFFGDQFSFGP